MIILTKKLTKRSLSMMILSAGVLMSLLIVLLSRGHSDTKRVEAVTEDGRMQFIESYGWKVDPEGEDIAEVNLPRVFDEVYTRYNLLQKAQGMDLIPYAGCLVTRYTYPIVNYPTGEAGVLIHLLVYDGNVIGGDVMSPRLDGFMHGFDQFQKEAR